MFIENENIVKDIEETGEYHRKNGCKIEINRGLPYIAISLSNDAEYFFQNEEAQSLLDEIPENVNEEDYIIWISQGW
jgi:hypothetical protein